MLSPREAVQPMPLSFFYMGRPKRRVKRAGKLRVLEDLGQCPATSNWALPTRDQSNSTRLWRSREVRHAVSLDKGIDYGSEARRPKGLGKTAGLTVC